MDYILERGSKNQKLGGFEIVSSITEMTKLTANSTVIIVSFTDAMFEIVSFLIEKTRNCQLNQIVYLSESQDFVLKSVISLLDGYIESNPAYLESEDNLGSLLYLLNHREQYAEDSALMEESAMSLVDFVDSQANRVSPAVARSVRDSLASVLDIVEQYFSKDNQSSIESVISEASFLIRGLKRDLKQAKESEERRSKLRGYTSSSVTKSYEYNGLSKVLLVEEKMPVRYLTSFMMSYAQWVQKEFNLKVRLVVVDNSYEGVDSRYSELLKVDLTTLDEIRSQLYMKSFLYTTAPNERVWGSIFEVNPEYVIVLDRTQGRLTKGQEILRGRKVARIQAVSSVSMMRKMSLSPSDTIVGDKGEPNQLGVIGWIDNYPEGISDRSVVYQDIFKIVFRALNKKAQIGRGV